MAQVKLLEKVEKAIEKVAEKHQTKKEAVLEKIKFYWKDDLFTYGLNVLVSRYIAGKEKSLTDEQKIEKFAEKVEALFNGQWQVKSSGFDKKKIIDEFLSSLPEDLQKIIKEKAGI